MADSYALDRTALLHDLKEKDTIYFKTESVKLQKWADDRIHAAEKAIRDTKAKIREPERQANEETGMQALL